uniref:Uncharacterized protein n=1 Tax=Lepeophtheirus salmonis TaxID=72036 RepID=A0A0K2V9T9_LEPSM
MIVDGIETKCRLRNTLYVPGLDYNLLHISQGTIGHTNLSFKQIFSKMNMSING